MLLMASNAFGNHFRITTFGESHGPQMGVVIDGCPAGLKLDQALLQQQMQARRPGGAHKSGRQETDEVQIVSGIYRGVTTGAPLTLVIPNEDIQSEDYLAKEHIFKPGHAQATHWQKYGVFDVRGGGRASGRETVCRVAAGAVAMQILAQEKIQVNSYLHGVGAQLCSIDYLHRPQAAKVDDLGCAEVKTGRLIKDAIDQCQKQGDSLGGIVAFQAVGVPVGLGEPVYEKLEAKLAHAMMTIPGSKGFSVGSGFDAALMKGSEHNDCPEVDAQGEGRVVYSSNHAGGVLAGVSTGDNLYGTVAFKPTSSIAQSQASVDVAGKEAVYAGSKASRHDPCIAVRAVPVVRAMLALVLVDCWLHVRLNRLILKESSHAEKPVKLSTS
jgi:chorismate synthase